MSAETASGVVIQAGAIAGVVHQQSSPYRMPTPRQLPLAPARFVGRLSELAQLSAVLDAEAALSGAAVVISVLAGTAGIGKTALALHWAYANQRRFPDGQLLSICKHFPGWILGPPHTQVGLHRSLPASHLGPQRMAVEPQTVADLLDCCAGLPLAPSGSSPVSSTTLASPLDVLAEELRDTAALLDGLDAGDLHSNLRGQRSSGAQPRGLELDGQHREVPVAQVQRL